MFAGRSSVSKRGAGQPPSPLAKLSGWPPVAPPLPHEGTSPVPIMQIDSLQGFNWKVAASLAFLVWGIALSGSLLPC